jgi:hypothetical protein
MRSLLFLRFFVLIVCPPKANVNPPEEGQHCFFHILSSIRNNPAFPNYKA